MPASPPADQLPDWEETPAEARQHDDRYWDVDRDYGDQPDDPSDHYWY